MSTVWAAGEGYYQLGEVRRLLGDDEGALVAFARARELGADPQPGEALLRCRMGDQRHRVDRSAARAGGGGPNRPHAAAARRRRGGPCPRTTSTKPKGIATNWNPAPRCSARPGSAHGRRMPAVRCWRSRDATPNRSMRCRRRCGSTAYSNRATRQPRCTSGWPWRTRHSATTRWPPPTLPPRRTSTRNSASSPHRSAASGSPGGLTPREIEILRRIAGGATNKQVAEQVCISEKTVGRHLANIYAKLGVSSRTAAVAWAHANNLL